MLADLPANPLVAVASRMRVVMPFGNEIMKLNQGFFTSLAKATNMAALLFCVACSSSNPSTGTSSAQSQAGAADLTHPCSFITQADADTAMGKGASIAFAHNPRTGYDECHVKGNTPGLEEVIILLHRTDLWDATKKAMVDSNTGVKAVSGLGDDAFEGRAIGYNVRKGSRYTQVFGVLTNKDAPNDKATRYLAERVASRL
jgi:hypothetical protein